MTKQDTTTPSSALEKLETTLDRLPAMDMTDAVERSLERTLNATTAEDVLADPESQGLADLVGKTFWLQGVLGCLESTKKSGPSRYLVLDCADDETGMRFTATTGSLFAMARILKLWELGALPRRVRAVELESRSNPDQKSLWVVDAK